MKIVLGLCVLLKLSGIRVAAIDLDNIGSVGEKPCRARAWVRAPDLEPGQVVQGEVRVKLDGACEQVQSYTLKLRFAERSWVKTKRPGVQFPKRPTNSRIMHMLPANGTMVGPSNCCMDGCSGYPETNYSAWNAYLDVVQDSSLWLAREEERIGFEAKYNLCDGKHIGHDVVEPFAILVPSTLYPPAFNPMYKQPLPFSYDGGLDATGSEHVYAYAVDVAFVNGSTLEVPAGYTSFTAPTRLTTPSRSETVNVTVSQKLTHMEGDDLIIKEEPEDTDVFILEVTFPHGRHLEQGSMHNITIVSHQIGPGLERPESVWCNANVVPKRHWAASLAADNETAERLLNTGLSYNSQLKPTNPLANSLHSSYQDPYYPYYSDLRNARFPQDGAAQNGTMFSTKPIVAQLQVWKNCYPNFQMHYQATEVELSISLSLTAIEVPLPVSNEDGIDSEEYEWIPTMRQSNVHSLRSRLLSAQIPLFIHPKQDGPTNLATTENVHYLSPEARAPVFVYPASVQDLLQKSMNERDALSPKAQPYFTTREGDAVEDRYFLFGQPGMHYVGDTWLRKVVLPGKEKQTEIQVGGLRIQS